jgi:glycosyltransferase involved in cell wall biosynthesis
MIVKNESRIITRCLDSLRGIISCLSIVDTGSNDNTKELIEQWYTEQALPGKVHSEPFQNFAYNRTHAYQMGKVSFPMSDYFLLSDADMLWENQGFDSRLLFEPSYLVRQYDSHISYWNIRLLSAKEEWQCMGVTHEYWAPIPEERPLTHTRITSLTIDDRGDGGCKADKFTRDERLLRAGLADPAISPGLLRRYSFYLAQTLRDMGKYVDSNHWYEKRVAAGGWAEEVYHSLYQIGCNHENIARRAQRLFPWLSKLAQGESTEESEEAVAIQAELNLAGKSPQQVAELIAESWTQAMAAYRRAWQYRPTRAEALYSLVNLYRRQGQHQLAYDLAVQGMGIKPPTDTLFVEYATYDYRFSYEITIVAYYLPNHRQHGKELLLQLLTRTDLPADIAESCRHNAKFYL